KRSKTPCPKARSERPWPMPTHVGMRYQLIYTMETYRSIITLSRMPSVPLRWDEKNYLFAGSHEAAQRSAMIYSLFAICKKIEVNPFQWLKYTLENIMAINHKNLKNLYPQNFKNNLQASNM